MPPDDEAPSAGAKPEGLGAETGPPAWPLGKVELSLAGRLLVCFLFSLVAELFLFDLLRPEMASFELLL